MPQDAGTDLSDDRSLDSSDIKHTPLRITTDSCSPTLSSVLLEGNSQPVSPINRKRADAREAQDGEATTSTNHSSLPPLKKSKTSLVLSQASLTEYRTSQEIADDPTSPQTSPLLEPDSPMTLVSSLNALSEENFDLNAAAVTQTIPILVRSRTLEEIRPSTPPAFINRADPGLESLSLGTRFGIAPARTAGIERAVGTVTISRQGSPIPGMADTQSRESTPMHVDDEAFPHPQNNKHSCTQDGEQSGPTADEMADPEGLQAQKAFLDLSLNYEGNTDDDSDEDYELAADTTVDEHFNRVDTSESDDDDSFLDIDVNNIQSSSYHDGSTGFPYHDTDPLCLDRLTEEEKAKIMDEAREFGISHIIQEYVLTGVYTVKKLLLMVSHEGFKIQENLTENELIGALTQRLERELQRRHRLLHIHTLGHVVDLLKHSKNIMVLTGAGVSVSCGIPDFRSSDGIYSRLSEFELDDPTQMFELDFFQEKPQVFYSFAREIFPSNFTPSPSHNFIKLLEDQGKLLRNYTQNIDTLEQKAGICRILQCHGSFATASCLRCKHQVPGDDIKDVILKQEVAYCKVCQTATSPLNIGKKAIDGGSRTNGADDTRPAVMKPDIVFFGERLPTVFDDNWDEDRDKVDLLIVIGSSLKVAPVSDIMHQLPKHIPQILINRTPITHMEFDVQLLGNCDTIVAELCRMAGWELRHEKLPGGTSNVPGMDINTNADGSGKGGCAQWSVIEPNTYTFEGAILGDIEYESSQSFSKERARFGSSEAEGYDADTDDDDEHHRRLTGERRGSLGIMILDTDSESDSSQDTIRGQGSSLPSSLNDKVADDSVDSTL